MLGIVEFDFEQANFIIVSIPLGGRVVRSELFGIDQAFSLMPDDRDDDSSGQFRYAVAEGMRWLDGEDRQNYDVFCRFDRAALMNELPNGGGD